MQRAPKDSGARSSPPERARLADHPTVRAVRSRPEPVPERLTLARIRAIALEAGADDVGVVSLEHPDLVDEVPHVRAAFPAARSLVSIVMSTHPDDIRSPARSVANLEFHRAGAEVDEVARRIAVALAALGHPSINPAMAFPMEMEAFPGPRGSCRRRSSPSPPSSAEWGSIEA